MRLCSTCIPSIRPDLRGARGRTQLFSARRCKFDGTRVEYSEKPARQFGRRWLTSTAGISYGDLKHDLDATGLRARIHILIRSERA